MTLSDDSEFIQSSCLQVVNSSTDSVVLAHLLSGKKYALGKEAFNLISSLQEPTSFGKLREQSPHVSPENLAATLHFLQEKELIFTYQNGGINETFHITSLNQTFCNVAAFDRSVVSTPTIVFLGIPYGRGNSISQATSKAPNALREFSHVIKVDLSRTKFLNTDGCIYDIDAEIDLSNLRNLVDKRSLRDWGNLYIYSQEYPHNVYDKISKATSILLKQNHIPFILGGDHSITYSILKAFNQRYENLHVLQFDAHTDTYSKKIEHVFKNLSTHNHGNFASRSLELENISRIYQFGVRGLNNFGIKLLDKQQVYWIGETKTIVQGSKEISLPDNVPYYVTLDIDVLEPSVAPGTASPVPGGLGFSELLKLLYLLLKNQQVVGLDLVEINPEKDKDHITVQIGLETILFLLNMLHL